MTVLTVGPKRLKCHSERSEESQSLLLVTPAPLQEPRKTLKVLAEGPGRTESPGRGRNREISFTPALPQEPRKTRASD